jgi:hypothetical protein
MMYKELFYTSSETYMVERDVKLLHLSEDKVSCCSHPECLLGGQS